MDQPLQLRRHLYDELARAPRRRRARRGLRFQIGVLAATAGHDPDDGSAGVREPRRPRPPAGPAARARP